MPTLTFLGTGTSQGVPVISCRCRVCTSTDRCDRRLRSSVLVEYNGREIIIDAGPDFRQQMLREEVSHIDAILLTHQHKDHIGGLDDVRAYNYTTGNPVDIYATRRVQSVIKKDFDYAFGDDRYPGVPDMNLHTIDPAENFRVKDIVVIPVTGLHYKLPVTGFRIGNMAYLTDFNSITDTELDKIKGVELLVINALRKEPHLSHFTLEEAVLIGRKAGAANIYLTHISHQMGLYREVEPLLPDGVHLSYDGLTIEFGAN
ncbi:MAG: MBL fold metallo-hydrolase [Rikenellaceae bacterium]|nr:MBL fold metallo-hydrolase [Rikenellaceae bacterium]